LRHNACTEGKESMFRLEQDENSLDQVLAGDVVLYVVRVMLNAERQQFHNDWQQMSRLIVVCRQHNYTLNELSWAKFNVPPNTL